MQPRNHVCTYLGRPEEPSTIDVVADQCFQAFRRCLGAGGSVPILQQSLLRDQFTRFTLWTNCMSVFAQGRASMHFRLRETPDVQLVVIGVLRTLLSHVRKWPELLSQGEPVDPPKPSKAEDRLDESPRTRRLRGMAEEINMLFTVSNIIRRGSRQSQNIKADEENTEVDRPLYERFLWHVRSHFPAPHGGRPAEELDAEEQSTRSNWETISSRLASTMLIRHKRVLYRKSRYDRIPTRMRQTVQKPKIEIPVVTQRDQQPPEPVATKTRPDPDISAGHGKSKAHSVVSGHTATTLTQRRFAKASAPSVISTHRTGQSTRRDALEFPQMPVHCVNEKYQGVVDERWPLFWQNLQEILKGEGGTTSVLAERLTAAVDDLDRSLKREFFACVHRVSEFTCPICFCALPGEVLLRRSKWESHVLGDLDAYVCLFQDCNTPKELHTHRASWIIHMREHTRRWSCVTKSHGKRDLTTREEYIDHITAEHSGAYTERRLQLLADRSSWVREQLFDYCPLCAGDVGAAKIEEHIAKHLRMLALTSLPHGKRYDEDNPHHDNKSHHTDSSDLSVTPTIAEYTSDQGDPEARETPAQEEHAPKDESEPPDDDLAEQQLREGISYSPWQGFFQSPSEPPLDDPVLKSLLEQQNGTFREPVSTCATKQVVQRLRRLRRLVGKERSNLVKEILGAIPTTKPVFLFKVLKDSWISCPLELGGGEYLPQSVVDKYAKEPHITNEGVPEELVQTIVASAKKVFIVLDVADKIEIARDMLKCGIRDADLPLRLDEGKDRLISRSGKRFRPFKSPWTVKDLRNVKAFLDNQWMVLPHILDDSGKHHLLDPKCALPFLDKLKPLGTANRAVFDCTIHKDFFRNVDDSPQPLQDGGDTDTEEQNSGRRVAVKKFTKWDDFEREINALRAVREANHPNLIRFLSSYEKSNKYYILLPWAEGGTLQNYWMVNEPKTAVRDRAFIRKSINQLLQLSAALQFLHFIKFRHGDLKPDNIFHFMDPSRQFDNFVIAGLGIPSHHQNPTNHFDRKAISIKATTLAYEAPEVWTDSEKPRSRKYDVWSMGCIILEHIIWLLWDADALDAFTDFRQHPVFAFYLPQGSSNSPKTAIVRPEVANAVKAVRDDPRGAAGTALRDLVDLVERGLLVADVKQRWDAEQLHSALSEIARKASAKGTGDAYVLPLKAVAPVRPHIFCGAGGRKTTQP
ncbi:hypothetical protein RB597_005806 [Gaeumannomyces tritici]